MAGGVAPTQGNRAAWGRVWRRESSCPRENVDGSDDERAEKMRCHQRPNIDTYAQILPLLACFSGQGQSALEGGVGGAIGGHLE